MKILTLIRLISAFLAVSSAVIAQDIPKYDLSNLSVGEQFHYISNDGWKEGTFIGVEGDYYLFSLNDYSESDGLEKSRFWVLQTGQVARVEFEDVVIVSYPNDCSFVVGECVSQISTSYGLIAEMKVVTSYIEGIWISESTIIAPDMPTAIFLYCGIVDSNGAEIALTEMDPDGVVTWARRDTGPYADQSLEMLRRVQNACQFEQAIS